MKILYLFFWDIDRNDGVIKKINNQIETWKKLGHDVYAPMFDTKYKKQYSSVFIQRDFLENIKEYNPDVIYLRYGSYRFGLKGILKQYNTVCEINADDIKELGFIKYKSLNNYIKYIYNFFSRGFILRNVVGLVSVTKELSKRKCFSKYNKKTFIAPNGINLDKNKFSQINNDENNEISLAFIGLENQPWNGLDVLSAAIEKLPENYKLDIIGINGTNTDKIRYHGFLNENEYSKILRKADIGIGPLARHLSGISETCALKIREYLSYGLPVLQCGSDTAFLNVDVPWFVNLNAPINSSDVASAILELADYSKKNLLAFDDIKPLIDINNIESNKLKWLEEVK